MIRQTDLSALPLLAPEAAVWMQQRLGWHVFAVGKDKKPFPGTKGCLDATNDAEQAQAMFNARPNANVAVATGSASGVFVVDVDVKNGVGWSGFEEFQRRYGPLPETLTIDTPSGGKHFYFEYPADAEIRNKGDLDSLKIDIRGEGGYVMAPPSVLAAGGAYSVACNAPIASAPVQLIARLRAGSKAATAAASSSGATTEGGRNSRLTSLAGTLRKRGLEEGALAAALHGINEAECRPPLDRSEVEHIARSVGRYAPDSRHPDTDLGNARRLVDALAGSARYDHACRAWFLYQDGCWQRDNSGAILRAAKAVVDKLLADAQAINDPDHRRRHIAFVTKSQSQPRLKAMVELAQSEPGISVRSADFDKAAYLLNVQNGTVDLRTGILQPHCRDDLLSRRIEIPFDAAAACPTFERFVDDIFQNDAELVEFVHRVLGYATTGETREQLFMVLYGEGSNGKSSLLRAVSEALGPYSTHTPTETLLTRTGSASNDVARLMGARFVTASEAEAHQRLNEGFIKQVTGDEPVTARYLYGEFFTFNPVFKLALATNALPAVNGSDPALFRRLRLIPFNRVFTAAEQDKELGVKLDAEQAGILAWLVRGAATWYRNGLTTPAAVLHAGAEFRSDSDTVATYLEDRCDMVAGEVIQASHLFRDYRRFTEDAGRAPLSQTAFGRVLTRRGLPAEKRGGSAYRVGIKFRGLAA